MRYDVPIYDPYKDRGEDYYHPGNEAAQCLVYIQQIYDDIARLSEILSCTPDKYGRKLIAKYIVVEWLSLDSYILKLVKLILSGQTGYPVDDQSRQELQDHYRKYKSARRKHWPSLKNIRNKIAAHRDPLDLVSISNLWDSLDISDVAKVLNHVPPLFNFMKDLNVYCWTKKETEEDGQEVIALVQPFISSARSPDV